MRDYKLTDAENNLAEIIWKNEPIQSPELVKVCDIQFDWKKSTTYTMLKKLEKKEIVQNRKGTVTSLLSKEEFYTEQTNAIVKEGFGGSLPRFLAAFTRDKRLSDKEVRELQKLIDEHMEEVE